MLGAIIMVVVLLVALPITFFLTGGTIAAAVGYFLKERGEVVNEGSELIELNR